jgi:acetyl-CoA synthetase (ADP-forming)
VEIIRKALKEARTTLTEHESKELLHAYGIPVTREKVASNQQEFIKAIEEIGYPLVIKACAPNLIHKTEHGLVHINIRNEEEAVVAFKEIMNKAKDYDGTVLVQEMIKGSRELAIGLIRDDQFGPCVMFGLGGIFTEVLKDISFRVAPIEKYDALDMMNEIKARRILGAIRGMPAADLDQIADILMKVGTIGLEQENVKEIDINPIILNGSQPIAVDALVVLSQ